MVQLKLTLDMGMKETEEFGKFCRKCGSPLSKKDKFCGKCGKSF